jgi:hypothetical protein
MDNKLQKIVDISLEKKLCAFGLLGLYGRFYKAVLYL